MSETHTKIFYNVYYYIKTVYTRTQIEYAQVISGPVPQLVV